MRNRRIGKVLEPFVYGRFLTFRRIHHQSRLRVLKEEKTAEPASGKNVEEGSRKKGESLGKSNEEEGERRREEERRRRGGRERQVSERREGDPLGGWADKSRKEIPERGRASERIRRRKGVAAITSPG